MIDDSLPIPIDPDTPELLRFFAMAFFNAWEEVCHSRDSAFLVLHTLPDWEKHYQEALANPDRIQHTASMCGEIQKILETFLEGTATRSQLEAVLQKLTKKPN